MLMYVDIGGMVWTSRYNWDFSQNGTWPGHDYFWAGTWLKKYGFDSHYSDTGLVYVGF